jgi:hypothetical protein
MDATLSGPIILSGFETGLFYSFAISLISIAYISRFEVILDKVEGI